MSRTIPWEAHEADALTKAQQRIVGDGWLHRMKQEHLAIGAFAQITHELAATGAEPAVLALFARAVHDEARHAEICGRYASIFLGAEAIPARMRGVPRPAPHEDLEPRARALLHVVEMCCFNETFTGIGFTEMIERTQTKTARAVLESLLADELDHGRVGWAHLASACQEGWAASVVTSALPELVRRAAEPIFGAERIAGSAENDAALRRYGHVTPVDAAALVREALDKVIFPGLTSLGVDVGPARMIVDAR